MLRTYLYKLTKKNFFFFFFFLEYIFFGWSNSITFYIGQYNLRPGLIRYNPYNVGLSIA